jgi:hypothetical protein
MNVCMHACEQLLFDVASQSNGKQSTCDKIECVPEVERMHLPIPKDSLPCLRAAEPKQMLEPRMRISLQQCIDCHMKQAP